MNDLALTRLQKVEQETARLDERTQTLEDWQRRQNGSLQRLEAHIERMDAKLDSHVERLDAKLDERIKAVEKKIVLIDEKVEDLCTHLKSNLDELRKVREEDKKDVSKRINELKKETQDGQTKLLYWVLGILGTPIMGGVIVYFINTFAQVFP